MKGSEKQIKWATDILDTMISGFQHEIAHREIVIKEFEKVGNQEKVNVNQKIIDKYQRYIGIYESMKDREAKEIIDDRNSSIFNLSIMNQRILNEVERTL